MKLDRLQKIFLTSLFFACWIYLYRYLSLAFFTHTDLAEDFQVYYRVALNMAVPYGQVPGAYHPYLYPPFFLPLLYPLKFFDYNAALILWFTAQLIFFAIALGVYFNSRNEKLPPKNLLIFAVLLLPFVINVFISGQTGLLTSGLLLLGFSQVGRRPYIAGALFALIMFKPQLVLLLPIIFLAKRMWKCMAAFVVTFGLLCAISVMIYGQGIWLDYFAALEKHSEIMLLVPSKLMEQMLSIYNSLRMLAVPNVIALPVHFAVAIILTALIYKKCRDKKTDISLLAFVGIFLISPYGFVYDTAIIAVVLYELLKDKGELSRVAVILGAFMPLVGAPLQAMHIPICALIMLLLTIVMLRRF